MTIEHEGVKVTATNFKPSIDELKLYVKRARELATESGDIADDITSVKVTLCEDGGIDLSYVAHHQKFERIRRISSEQQTVGMTRSKPKKKTALNTNRKFEEATA